MLDKGLLVAATLAAVSLSAVAATPARATDPAVNRWLSETNRAVEARLHKSQIANGDQTIEVRFNVDGEYLRSPQVVKSSGSQSLDASVASALKWVAIQSPPSELYGHAIVMRLAVGNAQTASTPAPMTSH